MIRSYRVLWSYENRPKADDFTSRKDAQRRANDLVSLNAAGVRFQRRTRDGEWVDIRPSTWDVSVHS
jgi:hypothetical protein